MKAVIVSEFGAPEVLRLGASADPQPAAGAVIVAIETVGLGFMDTMARRGGSYLATSPGFIPGYEVAGSVVDVGVGVDAEWLGGRVFAVLRRGGGCAERVEVPVDELIRLPDELSFEQAVATGLNALVAQAGLARVPIDNSHRVLVRGAGGGIGLMYVQYAALRAATVVATTSSDERGEQLRALGASSFWNRLTEPPEVLGSFNLIVDTVIGKELPSFLDKLGNNGHYLLSGGLDGLPPTDFGMKMIDHFHKSPTLYAFSLNSASPTDVAREAAVLFEHVQAGRISAVIDSVLPLSEAIAAHHKLDAGRAFGKIILKPDWRQI